MINLLLKVDATRGLVSDFFSVKSETEAERIVKYVANIFNAKFVDFLDAPTCELLWTYTINDERVVFIFDSYEGFEIIAPEQKDKNLIWNIALEIYKDLKGRVNFQ